MNNSKRNKVGKAMLFIGLFVMIGVLILLFSGVSILKTFDLLEPILLVTSIISISFSISLIYLDSEHKKRKNALIITSIASGILIIGGILSKFMYWRGASFEIIFGILFFCGASLPLIIRGRYERRQGIISQKGLLLNLVDLTSILLICCGLLWRIQKWYGGDELLISGIVLLLIGLVLWNNSFKTEVKLRHEAEEKLKSTLREVEEKNKEITDSINYAKRLQEAIFPSVEFIGSVLTKNFIVYKPRDIIAGDFYWAEKVGSRFIIAVADCTGHGVPGALVSVVCCNALNRSTKEFGLTNPGQILDKTRELVLESFSKKGEQINDGMDISLLSIEGRSIEWAGANNPLWYIRSEENGMKQLHEIKGTKQPIGFTDNPIPFTTHSLEMLSGDLIYLFTDGFADQFGGPNGKKFKYKPFQNLLIENSSKELNTQAGIIENTFSAWKGELEQVDDLCVIGIQIL